MQICSGNSTNYVLMTCLKCIAMKSATERTLSNINLVFCPTECVCDMLRKVVNVLSLNVLMVIVRKPVQLLLGSPSMKSFGLDHSFFFFFFTVVTLWWSVVYQVSLRLWIYLFDALDSYNMC